MKRQFGLQAGFTLLELMVGLAIVAILAVLKAGGAYTPIDPAWPSARVSDVLEDLSPVVVLSDAPVDTAVPVCRTSAWPASGMHSISRYLPRRSRRVTVKPASNAGKAGSTGQRSP